ncbi:MAG: class I SAM-dependent methyltransferase [Verrucomicrobiota bacterium]|nr:class I SAM-dependent methyltransferase [Verrucomicrobiota bacterium]MCC6820235.1 class I SAM-dependent methyltransferase [Limisphaerales bacterium]
MNARSIHRPCPVCGSATAEPHWQKGDLRLVRCGECGMIYANPIPADMASGAFYDAAGKDYYLSPAKLESDYAEVRFERELRLFRKHCPRGFVLDVGCSSGAFLFQLKKGWPGDYEILGTDVSGPPLDYAESRGVPVMRGDFLQMGVEKTSAATSPEAPPSVPLPVRRGAGDQGPEAGFDAITFWAVAEHLAEPKRFLEQAHALLKSGGLCFVLVPNFRSLAVRLLGARYRYVYEQHLNYFTAQTLTALVTPKFELLETRFTHFNPVVIWQDWRDNGREVSNAERGALLKRTTAYKQKGWMKPAKWAYRATENALAAFGLADNVVVVLKKRSLPPTERGSF